MIIMLMGNQNRWNIGGFAAQHLLAKIRTAIDNQALAIDLDKSRGTQALVPFIFWQTDRAGTTDNGYPLWGSGAKKCDPDADN